MKRIKGKSVISWYFVHIPLLLFTKLFNLRHNLKINFWTLNFQKCTWYWTWRLNQRVGQTREKHNGAGIPILSPCQSRNRKCRLSHRGTSNSNEAGRIGYDSEQLICWGCVGRPTPLSGCSCFFLWDLLSGPVTLTRSIKFEISLCLGKEGKDSFLLTKYYLKLLIDFWRYVADSERFLWLMERKSALRPCHILRARNLLDRKFYTVICNLDRRSLRRRWFQVAEEVL